VIVPNDRGTITLHLLGSLNASREMASITRLSSPYFPHVRCDPIHFCTPFGWQACPASVKGVIELFLISTLDCVASIVSPDKCIPTLARVDNSDPSQDTRYSDS